MNRCRRNLLAAAAVAPLAAVPAIAAPAADAEFLFHAAEYRRLIAELDGSPWLTEAQSDALYEQARTHLYRLIDLPATTGAGMLEKLKLIIQFEDLEEREAENPLLLSPKLARSLRADMERMSPQF